MLCPPSPRLRRGRPTKLGPDRVRRLIRNRLTSCRTHSIHCAMLATLPLSSSAGSPPRGVRTSVRRRRRPRDRSQPSATSPRLENRGVIKRYDDVHSFVRSVVQSRAARPGQAACRRRAPGDDTPHRLADGSRRASALSRRRLLVAVHVLHAGASSFRARRVWAHRGGESGAAFPADPRAAGRRSGYVDGCRPARAASDRRATMWSF